MPQFFKIRNDYWTFELFPFGAIEYCCHGHSCRCLWVHKCARFVLGINLGVEMGGHRLCVCSAKCFSQVAEPPSDGWAGPSSESPARLVQAVRAFSRTSLHSLQRCLGSASTSLWTLGKQFHFNCGQLGDLYSGHLGFGFILCFPHDQKSWASFPMWIDHLNLLFPGVPLWALQPLLKIESVVIVLLICRSLLCILDKNPWLDTCIAYIYCKWVCLFTLLVVYLLRSKVFKQVQFIHIFH